jgi:hypothetical protein
VSASISNKTNSLRSQFVILDIKEEGRLSQAGPRNAERFKDIKEEGRLSQAGPQNAERFKDIKEEGRLSQAGLL